MKDFKGIVLRKKLRNRLMFIILFIYSNSLGIKMIIDIK